MSVLRIHPKNPSVRTVQQVVNALSSDELVSYPTDSLYGVGCDPHSKKAVLKLCRLKGIDPKKANLTFLCQNLAQAAPLIRQLDRNIFKILRKNVPGPFTFILPASKEATHFFQNKKKTIGIRIPDHVFIQQLLEQFGRPILNTSLVKEDQLYDIDMESLSRLYGHQVSILIDDERPLGASSAMVEYMEDRLVVTRDGPMPLLD